jgi:hypothetical protein
VTTGTAVEYQDVVVNRKEYGVSRNVQGSGLRMQRRLVIRRIVSASKKADMDGAFLESH